MEKEELRTLFAEKLSFWTHLSGDEQTYMLENAYVTAYEKGTPLLSSDMNCIGVLLVRRGQLRVYMLSEDGREITLYRLFSGDVCVLSASCVLDTITFDVCIDTEEPTEIIIIPASLFRQLSQSNVYVECFGYQITTERFSDVMWAMQQILFMSFDRRLAIFLIDELTKIEGDTIHLTHEQIAKYMGSAREVVSRMLKYFAGEGLVQLSRGGVRVPDKRRLRTMYIENNHSRTRRAR